MLTAPGELQGAYHPTNSHPRQRSLLTLLDSCQAIPPRPTQATIGRIPKHHRIVYPLRRSGNNLEESVQEEILLRQQ
jgi:hypothetical protein